MAGQAITEIPLTDLSLQQLSKLSQQLEKDVELLQSSLSGLKLAQTKFSACKETLNSVVSSNDGKEVLVPLNSSIYVPGVITDTERVLVDVGTGYYAEMEVEKAKGYYQRKVKYLEEQMTKIQAAYQEKFRFKEAVIDVIQSKVQAQMASNHKMATKS